MEVAEAACDARSDRGRRTRIRVAHARGSTTGHDVVVPGGMESLADVADLAVLAESLGYDRISVPEATGRDVVTAPQLFTPAALADRMDDLRRGADLGDRDPDDLRVAVTVRSCALEDGDCAREVARQQVARLRTVGPRKTRRGLSRPRGASLRRWSPGNGRCLRSPVFR